jgi:hypothetical protein
VGGYCTNVTMTRELLYYNLLFYFNDLVVD